MFNLATRISVFKNKTNFSHKAISVSRCFYGTEIFKNFANQSDLEKKQPAPHKLPVKDQLEFERLIQKANSEMIFEEYNESISKNTTADINDPKKFEALIKAKQDKAKNFKGLEENQEQVSTPKTYSTNTIPEFEGNINPKTGEVNGPKQDPLKYGDWSFNGRVTDF